MIGSSITMDGKARQIIGVLPRGFHFLDYPDAALVMPFQWDRSKTKLGNFSQRALARLKPGVTMEQASADMARLLPITIRSFPAPDGFSPALFEKAHIQPNLRPLKQDVVGDVGKVLWVLMGSIAHGAAGGLRQRGQSAAGARGRPPPGARDSLRAGRALGTNRRRAAVRKRCPRRCRQRDRARPRLRRFARAGCAAPTGLAAHSRNRHRPTGAAVHPRPGALHQPADRHHSGLQICRA